ncbi:hypothetical protein SKB0068_02500 [Staphylococcus hominis subsp. novobiosepticus]
MSRSRLLIDALSDRSLTLVDVDALSDVLVLVESLTLVDVDALSDVLVLPESLTLVDVDALDVLDTF